MHSGSGKITYERFLTAHATTAKVSCTDKSPFPSSFLETLKYIMKVRKKTGTTFSCLVSETKTSRNIKPAPFM